MKPASAALLRAIGDRLTAAYAAAAVTCPWSVNPAAGKALPYGVLGNDTENDAFSTKSTEGGVLTHTLRIYAKSDGEARRLASIAIADLTDRTNRLTFDADGTTSFYQASRTVLELNQVIAERTERGDIYGAVIRFRFLIGQITGA
jgi:hypothetical protein